MRICQRMRWRLDEWFEMDSWQKDRWIDHEAQRTAFAEDLLEISTNDEGKTYLEQYIPIILSLHN